MITIIQGIMPRRSVEISETTIRDQNGILEVKIQLAKVPENGQVADNNDDDEIEAISKDDIRGGEKTSKTVEFKIQDFTDIASYNWLDRPDPTILVPGSWLFAASFLSSFPHSHPSPLARYT